MRKNTFCRLIILPVLLVVGVFLLAGCDAMVEGTMGKVPEKWMPTAEQSKNQLPAGSVSIPGFVLPIDTQERFQIEPNYDVGQQAHADFIFIGSLEKSQRYFVTHYPPYPERPAEEFIVSVLTVKVEAVLSGDAFKTGETCRLFGSWDVDTYGLESPLQTGEKAVYFAWSMDKVRNTETGKTGRELDLELTPDLKESMGTSDLEISTVAFDIFPIEAGYVSACLGWAWDVEPSVALGKEEFNELARGIHIPGGLDPQYRAYFTEEDFIASLKSYQSFYKEGFSILEDPYREEYLQKYNKLRVSVGQEPVDMDGAQ